MSTPVAFKSAVWQSGLLTVTYASGIEETFEVTVAEAKQGVQDILNEFHEAMWEIESERMAEAAATRYWEEGPASFQMYRAWENDMEDRRAGRFA